jgi:hypothetical protein
VGSASDDGRLQTKGTESMNRILTAAAFLALCAPASAASTEGLMNRYYTANEICRGTSPSPSEEKACVEREAVSKKLEARGYCFTGVIGADTHWEFAGSRKACKQIQARDEERALRGAY